MRKDSIPPINFVGESNLTPSQPSVPTGNQSVLQHFYSLCKKYRPKIKFPINK